MAEGYSRPLCFFSFFLIHLLVHAMAQGEFLYHECSNTTGNYTTNSAYETNLKSVLSSIFSNTVVDYGFYNESLGQEPDTVNAIALCRGDLKKDACRVCLRNATQTILQVCPNKKEAAEWFDECMLRYSNRSIFGTVDNTPLFHVYNLNNVSDDEVSEYKTGVETLLHSLRSIAAAGDSLRKFATGNTTINSKTIYALVQCTPDLSEKQCSDCLDKAIGEFPKCCERRIGGRAISPSCNFRFETNSPFFDPAAVPSPLEPPQLSSQGNDSNTAHIVLIVVIPIVTIVVLIISFCIFLRRRKPKKNVKSEPVDGISGEESLQFDFNTIRLATDNFSDANKLGRGGFGAVYKGRLPNGQEIAAKRLSKGSGQGDLEFKNEVQLVAKLQHRNLVRLLGFSLEAEERILIYEFVPNKSLDHFIFDPLSRAKLDWHMRYKIIGGIARGLLYLHEDSRLRIIHRDLKASNILLDEEMQPKITDFGMAKLFEPDETQGCTSRIVGTYGYMAPEYLISGHFSVKSDVFSFGVLVLEMISGQKNNYFRNGENDEHLLTYAWKIWNEGTTSNFIDPTLSSGSRTEIMRCIHIGLLCVQQNVASRPTMASVAIMLNTNSINLQTPSQPGFFMHSDLSGMSSSTGYNSRITESSTSYNSRTTESSTSYNSRITEDDQPRSGTLPLSTNETSITELYPR